MCWQSFVTIFLSYLTFIQADGSLNCTSGDHPKTRIFQSLVQYEANKLSFNPNEPNYNGNYVSFNLTAIDQLAKNAFITFSSENIISIDLSNKSIKEIYPGAFLNLNCLHYLNLSNNKISNLTNNTFLGIQNLRTLNLSGNSLTYLYDGVFFNLKRIEVLDISQNRIKDLDKSVLSDIPTLQKLIFSYNHMKRMVYSFFSKLLHLKELYLDHNEIAMAPVAYFAENNPLEKLDLSGNSLVLFSVTNASVLQFVKYLNLSDNYLTNLSVDDLLYLFPNENLTIDLNNNPFYCSNWGAEYLKEFQEKHVNVAPERNFSQKYYIGSIGCVQYNSSFIDNEAEDTFGAKGTGVPDSTVKGVAIGLAVIGVVFLILVTLNYVLGIGFMAKLRWRVRHFLSPTSADENSEYVTLTPPS